MTTSRPDFLIRNAQGYPIAVVEVKNRQNLSPDIAKELRSNMVARGIPSHVPYFLLLSQDVGFLWNGTKQDNPEIKAELSSYNCRYISSFNDGFRYIKRFVSM